MNYEFVARLLEDPRVQVRVNVQNQQGDTAFHYACRKVHQSKVPAIIQRLLQVGGDLTIKNAHGETSLALLQESHPTLPTTLALVEQNLDAEKASFLVKARRLTTAATRTTAPSFLQGRVASGLPLPNVALAPVTEDQGNDDAEGHKFRTMLTFLVGLEGEGMPRDVFRVVLDLLMPFWDPLRRKVPEGGG